MSKVYPFFQQIAVNGRELPVNNLAVGTYIERINLDGPQLILSMSDSDSSLRDNFGLVDGATLEVKMGDPDQRGDAYFSSRFTVLGVQTEGTQVRVEALEAGVHALKQPVSKPLFFNGQPPAEILGSLFPGYKVDADYFKKTRLTYHVTSSATPSAVLRMMARDLGAALWVARGTVYCIPYANLGGQKEGYPTFESQSQESNHPILAYSPAHVSTVAARTARRCYMSWDTVAGMQKGTMNPDAPRSILTAVPATALDGISAHAVPCLLADMAGNGAYRAGMTVGVRLHRVSSESVIDESIPLKQMIMIVSHKQEGGSYNCKVTTGVSQI